MEEDNSQNQQSPEHQKDLSLPRRQLEDPSKMANESIASSGTFISDHGGSPTLIGFLATGIGQSRSKFIVKTCSNGVADGNSNGSGSSEKSN